MIYFRCPSCGEELEAEDSIRGARMNCPACNRPLEVPSATVRGTSRSVPLAGRRYVPSSSEADPAREVRFFLAVIAAGMAGLLVLSGAGYVLNRKIREARGSGSACSVCSGRKSVSCARCAGAKAVPCGECQSTGRRKNWKDEEEACFACNGTGRQRCAVCGGEGEYSCAACYGTGQEGAPPPPLYDFK